MRALVGALVVVASVVAALALYARIGDRTEVLAVARDVLAGEQITDADLEVVSISSDDAIPTVPASQRSSDRRSVRPRPPAGRFAAVADSVQPRPLVDPERVLMSVVVPVGLVPGRASRAVPRRARRDPADVWRRPPAAGTRRGHRRRRAAQPRRDRRFGRRRSGNDRPGRRGAAGVRRRRRRGRGGERRRARRVGAVPGRAGRLQGRPSRRPMPHGGRWRHGDDDGCRRCPADSEPRRPDDDPDGALRRRRARRDDDRRRVRGRRLVRVDDDVRAAGGDVAGRLPDAAGRVRPVGRRRRGLGAVADVAGLVDSGVGARPLVGRRSPTTLSSCRRACASMVAPARAAQAHTAVSEAARGFAGAAGGDARRRHRRRLRPGRRSIAPRGRRPAH